MLKNDDGGISNADAFGTLRLGAITLADGGALPANASFAFDSLATLPVPLPATAPLLAGVLLLLRRHCHGPR